jgi:fructose-specific phosphotransferase system IIA component
MGLLEILDERCVLLDSEARDKQEIIAQMVDLLAGVGAVEARDDVLNAVLERERVMSTGIGGGVAIPHAQSKGVGRLAVALARPKAEIDFESLDGRPVGLVFLIVGPEERGGYVRVLARISRLLYTGDLQKKLHRARTADEALRIIDAEEENLKVS